MDVLSFHLSQAVLSILSLLLEFKWNRFPERSNRIEHLMLLMSVNDTIIQGLKEMIFKQAGII